MGRVLGNVHRSATRLHDAGYLDRDAMRKFDAICLARNTLGDDLIEAMSEAVAEITNDAEHAAILAEIGRLMDLVPDTVEGAASPEGRVLIALAEAVSAYEGRRWPYWAGLYKGSGF